MKQFFENYNKAAEEKKSEKANPDNAQIIIGDHSDLQDHAYERRQLSEKEEEILDRKLQKLSQLMNGAEVQWRMDGAINISVMRRKYIGIHKDVDISIDDKEVEKLDEYLGRNGYGLFIKIEKKEGLKKMVRVNASDFRNKGNQCCEIAAIDEYGRIIENEALRFIDVHIVDTNDSGEYLMGDGTVFPKKWFNPIKTEFHGAELNLSHPAKIVFFKLNTGRPYDEADIKILVSLGKISKDDITDMKKIFSSSLKNQFSKSIEILREVYKNLSGSENSEQITSALLQHPEIAKYIENPNDLQAIRKIAEEFSLQDDVSFDKFKDIAFKFSEVEDQKRQYEAKLLWLNSIIDECDSGLNRLKA